MKWAIFIPRVLSEKVGGTKVYVDQFASAVAEKGNDVHIFTTSLDASLPEHERVGPVTLHRTFVNAGTAGPLRLAVRPRVTRQFLNVDEAESFDVINSHSAFLLRRSMIRREIPIIQTFHAVVTYEYMYKLKKIFLSMDMSRDSLREILALPAKLPLSYALESRALRDADVPIVMSNYVKGVIESWFPTTRHKKVFVSRIGIDVDAYATNRSKVDIRESLGISGDEIVLFTVRRLVTRMGLENLIRAFAISASRSRDQKMRLFIAGEGPLRKRLERLIRKDRVEQAVSLLGFIPDDVLKLYYRAADVFIMPTEQLEGFGIVSIEALANDLPVIATPAGANPEVVGPICPELMAASTAPEDIADRIEHYIRHRSEYVDARYSDIVRRGYSWPDIVDEIVSLLPHPPV